MPTWDADQYLRFEDERTRPCHDLAARVAIEQPQKVIDLGCGPGNSTAILAARWPQAQITGLDSSADMIRSASAAFPARRWIVDDITRWAEASDEQFDVVFSNAALQWVDNHAAVFPKLMRRVAAGGVLAVQMPANFDAPAHALMRKIAKSPSWRNRFTAPVREWHVHEPAFYYDVLCAYSRSLELWVTDYFHILPSASTILEWYKGTGLRPFLQSLRSDEDRDSFEAEYLREISEAFPAQPDGRVLFPFRRLFIVAGR